MLGVFMALDLFLFYVMWEVMLVPMYFIVGIWGGERRIYASLKFFIYTMVGSLLMLVGILYLGSISRATTVHGIVTWCRTSRTTAVARHRAVHAAAARSGCFGAFFLAFAVKVPMFPFHTWLPDAHVEAPTAGSVVLASDHAEARHVRLPPPRRAALPERRDEPDGAHGHPRARGDRHRLRRARVARAARLQEARRLLARSATSAS